MLKKVFSSLLMAAMFLCVAGSSAFASSVSVVLDTPAGYFSEPEKVYKVVQASLDKIFQGSMIDVKSVQDCDAYVQIYREENDLAGASDSQSGGRFHRDLTFKKADIEKMADYFGDDHVVYIRVSTTDPRSTGGIFTSGKKVNVILDFRIWSQLKKDFSYMKRVTTTGGSETVNLGGIFGRGSGSLVNAIDEGLKKGLQDVEKEKSKVLAAFDK